MQGEEKALVGVFAAALLLGAVLWLPSIIKALRQAWVRYRAITDTPTTPMRSLRPGFREVRGRVVRPAEPIISP